MNDTKLQSVNDSNFYSVLQDVTGVAIVFFTSTGCNSCRYWKALLEQLAEQRPALQVFEIDAEQSMGLAREYEVFHLPALFVFVNGQFHAPLQCEARLETIDHALDRLLAAPAQEAP
jgi:thioredoxin-like negative regulator of GroEL